MNQFLILSHNHIPSKGIALLGERKSDFLINFGDTIQIKFNGRLYQFPIVGIEKYKLPLFESLNDQSNTMGLLIDEIYQENVKVLASGFPLLFEILSFNTDE
ncbi:MAG: hypothetical protein EP332_11770 [Bacteroidetes bacterium]|nr:MAG: hypothetical protein EP332_11770 [Bacteroidota bacterium]